MGGVTMTTLSASHTIYNNAAAPLFSGERSQLASTYFSQDNYNYYVVSGFYNFDGRNVLELGWRMFRRRHDDNDMTFDAGYARRIGERWSGGPCGALLPHEAARPGVPCARGRRERHVLAAARKFRHITAPCGQEPDWPTWAPTSTPRA